ncbi:MAG TPA: YdcF family protein [Alphaproteobacteria bacterium]|nr:YdcF family protein [Alphaproteobacteria bacterium]
MRIKDFIAAAVGVTSIGFANFAAADCTKTHPAVGIVFTGGAGRVEAGLLALQNGHIAKLHISGTPSVPTALATQMGLSDAQIRQDISTDNAHDTEENGKNSAAWLKQHPACKAILYTEQFHMERASMWQRYWMQLDGVNIPLLTHAVPNQTPQQTNPSSQRTWKETLEPLARAIAQARINAAPPPQRHRRPLAPHFP